MPKKLSLALVVIEKLKYAKSMHKLSYWAFLILFFISLSQEVNGAQDQSKADQIENATTTNLTVTVDQYSEQISSEILNKWISHNSSFSMWPDTRGEFENSSYCPVNKIFCNLTLTKIQRYHMRISSQSNIETQAIKTYLEDLARKTNKDPVDPKFTVVDGKVTTFSEAKGGVILNIDKSVDIITDVLKKNDFSSPQNITLAFDSKKTTSNYGDVNNLGISSLIGEGTSNFKGSPKNRIFNIKVATERFNGLLIKPGEEFSFVKNLGEVDGEHGYLPELVIKNNVTEPEFGGGICQVSSTAFRAAIYSGLKITARRNHAYPVSYYNPQGMDSTVYVPNPDLRFVNNTPNHILIQTKIVGTQLIFDFYGTDDGRKTTIDGPYTTDKKPDGSLKAHFTQTVLDKNGKEFINDTFNSSYGSPYRYPHPGGPILSVKPSNWSDEEWKNYKNMLKDMAKAALKAKN